MPTLTPEHLRPFVRDRLEQLGRPLDPSSNAAWACGYRHFHPYDHLDLVRIRRYAPHRNKVPPRFHPDDLILALARFNMATPVRLVAPHSIDARYDYWHYRPMPPSQLNIADLLPGPALLDPLEAPGKPAIPVQRYQTP